MPDADGEITVTVTQRDGKTVELRTDAILVATGRKPSVKGIGLEAAGIDYNEHVGVKARTSCARADAPAAAKLSTASKQDESEIL